MQELYTALKKKNNNKKTVVNIGSSKLCALRPKKCVLAVSKMTHSVCVCSAHQNVASGCNGLGLDIQRPDQEDDLQHWEQQMHHASVWILSWHCNSERISWSKTLMFYQDNYFTISVKLNFCYRQTNCIDD